MTLGEFLRKVNALVRDLDHDEAVGFEWFDAVGKSWWEGRALDVSVEDGALWVTLSGGRMVEEGGADDRS